MKIFLKTLRRHELKYAGFFTFYVVAAVVVSVCTVLVRKLTGDISQAALEFDSRVLTRFLVIMAILTGIKAVFAAASALVTGRFSGKTAHRLRDSFARYFTYARFEELERKTSGPILSLYTGDVAQTADMLAGRSLDIVSGFITTLTGIVYMATISPLYTLIFAAMFPPLIWMQAKISTPIQKKAIEMSTARAGFNAVVMDSLQNTSVIVAYSLEDAMERRYLTSYDKYYKAAQDYLKMVLTLVIGGIFATIIPTVFVFIASGLAASRGTMGFAEFIAYTSVAGMTGDWLTMLSQNLRTLRVNAASAVRLNDNMDEPPEDLMRGADLADGGGAVAFEGVSFAYPGGPAVLDGVSFKIAPDAKTAIVGASGSGKSTVLKLLLGLYDLQDGDITVSGQSTRELSKAALRGTLAYVPQDSFMFPGTIRENLTLTRQDMTDERVLSACEGAGILGFINSLPSGLDTVLAEAADNISGGQRQRLAIARAFLQNAPVVLLDEATSALDPVTEAGVLGSLGTLTRGRTVIMVTHRPAAVAACDTVIVMDKGRVAGVGSHAELLAGNALYASLYESMRREAAMEGAGNE